MQQEPNGRRRVKVTGRRGIYYRETPTGRRYEITFTDSDGVQRWRTIDGGLKEADGALAEVKAKLGRGERVVRDRRTLKEYADAWIAEQTQLRPRTKASYETHLRLHVLPRLGRLRITDVNEDDVAALIVDLRAKGLSGWTIRTALTPLGRILGHAARRGRIPANPVQKLERDERPKVGSREQRILDHDEIEALLAAARPTYRPLLATAIFTGLRQGELLGLTWADVDFEAGLVSVRRQLDRSGERVEPKTAQAIRDVVLMPALGRILKSHKADAFARGIAKPTDYVFTSTAGKPLYWRTVSRQGLELAVERAGLSGEGRPRLRFHDLRHSYASLLIAGGGNVVFVSRQLGHADAAITLRVYAHLFDRAEHAQRTRDALEASFGTMLDGAFGR